MHHNIEILTKATELLGDLTEEMVFLGGCVVGLMITDKAAPEIRATVDVDAIIQVASRSDYYQLSERLYARGFHAPTEENPPICRFQCEEIILDVMPTQESILGFSNSWYEPAILHSQRVTLPNGREINQISPAYFLATKLAAFYGRGNNDFLMSHDIEDIVAVLDGRPEIVKDVNSSDEKVRKYLVEEFSSLLETEAFFLAIEGHLASDESVSKRRQLVVDRILSFIDFYMGQVEGEKPSEELIEAARITDELGIR